MDMVELQWDLVKIQELYRRLKMVSKTSRQELAIQRAKKYLRSQGIMNKRDEDKMSDKVRKKMEEILKKSKGGGIDKFDLDVALQQLDPLSERMGKTGFGLGGGKGKGKVTPIKKDVKNQSKVGKRRTRKMKTTEVARARAAQISTSFKMEGKKYGIPIPKSRFDKKGNDLYSAFKAEVLRTRDRKYPSRDFLPRAGQPTRREYHFQTYGPNYKKTKKPDDDYYEYTKGGAASRREAYQEATKKAAGKRITSSNVKKAEKALKKRRMQQKAKEAGLFITGKAEGGIPKSRLINPYVSVRKSKEFTKNEKAAAEIKREGATIGARIKNLNVGVTYDKDKYTKPRFTQKMTKKGVNIGVGGRKGNLNISAGKKTESNPFEGKKTGKYYEIQGTVNFSRGGRAAIRGTKFTGIK